LNFSWNSSIELLDLHRLGGERLHQRQKIARAVMEFANQHLLFGLGPGEPCDIDET
jgi:hypothetical protein